MADNKNLNPDPSQFTRTAQEITKLTEQYNKFARAGAEDNASALDYARILNVELRDSLGVKQKLNDQELALRNLGNEVVKAVQQNVIELGNAGKINREIAKAQSLQNKLVTEITSIAGDLNDKQVEYAHQLANTYSIQADISKELINAELAVTRQKEVVKELESRKKTIGDLSEEESKRLQEQLANQKNILDNLATTVKIKTEERDLGDALIKNLEKEVGKGGKLNAQTANRLAALLAMKAAHQNNISELQEEEQIQRKIQDRMGVSGAIVGGTGALMERLGMRSGIFHQAMKDAQTEMEKLAEQSERVDPATGEIMKNASKLQVMLKGAGELASGFGKALFDPLTFITAIVSKALELNAASVKLQRLTGQVNDKQAAHNRSLASGAQVMGVMAEMTETTGIAASAMFSSEDLGRLAEAKNLLGLSSKQASNLGMLSKASGTSIQGYKEEVVSSVNEFNALNDSAVAHGVIIQDVLNASADVSMSLGGSAPKITAAAAAARKLGLDLTKVNQIADGLLDFESSIESELEAQLLTGKQINLNKARELALNNDLEGVANELAKNGASAAEFAKMNRIQQEGMAKALGMNREEMGKMLINQEGQKNLSLEQRAAMRGVTLEQLEQMEASESLQLAFGKIAEPLASILSSLAPIVTMIAKVVAFVAPFAPYLLLAYGATKLLAGGFINIAASAGSLGKSLRDKYEGISGFFKNFKSNMSAAKSSIKDFGNTFKGALTGKVQAKSGGLFDKNSPQGKMIENMKKGGGKTAEAGKGIADSSKATKAVTPGNNIKLFLTNLSQGLQKMGTAKVLYGALNLIPASLGLVAMIPGVVGAKLMELISGPKLLISMQSLALGLTAMGGGKVLLGTLGLSAAALAFVLMIPASAGMALLGLTAPIAASGIMVLIPALIALGSAMATGVGALGLAALIGMAVGLGAGFALIGAGAMMLGKGIQFAAQGFVSIFGQLGTLVTMLPQLYLLGGALMSIAAGLGMIAVSGLAAIPALAALSGFVLMATPLMAVSGIFGGGSDKKDTGFAELGKKVDTLIAVISNGGDVYLDSDKIGRTQAKSFSRITGS